MKNEHILDAIGTINDDAIRDARAYQWPKSRRWTRWGAMAACLCLLVVGAFVMSRNGQVSNVSPDDLFVGNIAFTMDGNEYFPITFNERKDFGLVPKEDIGLTEDNTYQISEADLGDFMGTIEECPNKKLVGAQVFYFSAFPNNERIAIVAVDGLYAFYVKTETFIGLQEIANYSDLELNEKLIGHLRNDIVGYWGEADEILSNQKSEKYYLNDEKSTWIILNYNDDGWVDSVAVEK